MSDPVFVGTPSLYVRAREAVRILTPADRRRLFAEMVPAAPVPAPPVSAVSPRARRISHLEHGKLLIQKLVDVGLFGVIESALIGHHVTMTDVFSPLKTFPVSKARASCFRALRDHGITSRSEIARLMGAHPTTVTKALAKP